MARRTGRVARYDILLLLQLYVVETFFFPFGMDLPGGVVRRVLIDYSGSHR